MTDTQIEGGPEWERNEAAKDMAAAIEAGDSAALEIAASRLGDAVVNASTSRLIKTLIDTIKVEIKPEIGALATDVRTATQRSNAIYGWLETEFQTNAKWRDKYSGEIDATLAAVQEVAVTQKKQSADIQALKAGQDAMVGQISNVDEESRDRDEQIAARLDSYIAGSRRHEVDALKSQMDAFKIALAQLGAAVDIAANAMIVIDQDQRITSVNEKALALFGYEEGELLDQPIDMLIPERYRDQHRAHIDRFARSGVLRRRMADRQPIFVLRKDGTEIPIEATISRVPGGFTAAVVPVGRE